MTKTIQSNDKETDEESDPISLLNFLAHTCSFHFKKMDEIYRAGEIKHGKGLITCTIYHRALPSGCQTRNQKKKKIEAHTNLVGHSLSQKPPKRHRDNTKITKNERT